MFRTARCRRLTVGLAALTTLVFLTPPALAEAHVRFGYGGHRSHHSYHKYRSHHGYHGYHHYRRHYGYRYSPYRHRAYRYRRPRYYHRGYISRYAYRRSTASTASTARIVVVPQVTSTTSDYPTTSDTSARGRAHANTSTTRDGWRLFETGRYDRAFNAFSGAATSHPTEGEPKLGYSLSAAMRGDDELAAYAMRRVLKYEPGLLDQQLPVPIESIQKLIDRYEYQDSDDGRLMLRTLKRLQEAQRELSSAESSPPEDR